MPQPKVTVHGKFATDGVPSQGVVRFSDVNFSVDSSENVIHTPAYVEQYLDQNGEFWAQLPLNVGINSTPAPRSYHVEVDVEGAHQVFDFVLDPTSLQVELSDLIPTIPPPSLPVQYVASLMGMTGNISLEEFSEVVPELMPSAGKSAYQLWLDNGNAGSFNDFLTAIKGPQGNQGVQGAQGDQGVQGPQGLRGPAGPSGKPFHVEVVVDSLSNLLTGGQVVVDPDNTIALPKYSVVAVTEDNTFRQFDGAEWINLGSYRGPAGPAGATQTAASLGLAALVDKTPANIGISDATQAALTALAATVGQVQSVNGQTGTVTLSKADLGLGNVDITSDNTKLAPLTVAVNALTTQMGTKQDSLPASSNPSVFLNGTRQWAQPTPGQVGLSNVKNLPNMDTLAAGTNLDTVTTPGNYIQPNSTALTDNYPIARPGFLQVLGNTSGTTQLVQIYTSYGYAGLEQKTYRRAKYAANAWSQWRQLYDSGAQDPVLVQSISGLNGGGLSATGVAYGKSWVPNAAATLVDLDSATTAHALPLAPSAASSWTAFPQGYSMWRVQQSVSGSPTNYPALNGTLEMYRFSTYPRQIFTDDTGLSYIRQHTGGSWGTWHTTNYGLDTGTVACSTSAGGTSSTTVTYASKFDVRPQVVATYAGGSPGDISVAVANVTTTTFDVRVYRATGSGSINVFWVAVGM